MLLDTTKFSNIFVKKNWAGTWYEFRRHDLRCLKKSPRYHICVTRGAKVSYEYAPVRTSKWWEGWKGFATHLFCQLALVLCMSYCLFVYIPKICSFLSSIASDRFRSVGRTQRFLQSVQSHMTMSRLPFLHLLHDLWTDDSAHSSCIQIQSVRHCYTLFLDLSLFLFPSRSAVTTMIFRRICKDPSSLWLHVPLWQVICAGNLGL